MHEAHLGVVASDAPLDFRVLRANPSEIELRHLVDKVRQIALKKLVTTISYDLNTLVRGVRHLKREQQLIVKLTKK